MEAQALTPTWKLDAAGRRKVEDKAETKAKLRRSPDDLDSLNLAFYPVAKGVMEVVEVQSGRPERSPYGRRAG
jgi:hypothetical protein